MIIHTNQIEGTKYDTNAVMLKNYILFLILRQQIFVGVVETNFGQVNKGILGNIEWILKEALDLHL